MNKDLCQFLDNVVKVDTKEYGFELDDVYLATDYTGRLLTMMDKGIALIGYVTCRSISDTKPRLYYPPIQIQELSKM